jgi:hypothetical protein
MRPVRKQALMSHAMRILAACVVLLVGCNRADRESIRIESNTRAWREMPPISTDSSAGVELQTRMLAALQKAQLKEGLTSPTIGASIVTLRKSEIAIIVYWVEQSPTVTEVVVGVNNERARFPLSSDERLRLATLSKEGDLTLYKDRPDRREFGREVILTGGDLFDPLGLENAWPNHSTILVSDGIWRLKPDPNPPKGFASRLDRSFSLINTGFRQLRHRQVVEAFQTGLRQGAVWSISVNISEYQLSDALPCPEDRTSELAALGDPFSTLDSETQERLINWGYAICDAALRKHYPPKRETKPKFPYPKRGV